MVHNPLIHIHKSPSLKGNCKLKLSPTWTSCWNIAGGVSILLYLISTYIQQQVNTADSKITMGNIRGIFQILTLMMSSSMELRDNFLQIHGFHILAANLRQLRDKPTCLDCEMVNCCFKLLEGLGLDGIEGDGISSALQGLFFDFSLWDNAKLDVKLHLITRLSETLTNHSVVLYNCIGVQRILDILRLHILRNIEVISISTNSSNQNDKVERQEDNQIDTLALECADVGHALLSIAMEAALDIYQKNQNNNQASKLSSNFVEGEMLFACLEETGSVLLAERLLRSLIHLMYVAPSPLKKVIISVRFAETTCLQLLTRPLYSDEVRRSTLVLLFWYSSLDVQKIPDQLFRIRDNMTSCPIPLKDLSTLIVMILTTQIMILQNHHHHHHH